MPVTFLKSAPQPSHRSSPRVGVPLQAAPAPKHPEERLLGLDILIVEDEVILAHDLAFVMEDAGAAVIGPVFTLDEAYAAVIESGFHADAAILDVDLAGVDVFPVARKLEELGIPFLFHTGHGDKAHLLSLFPDAIVCMKPALDDQLVARLQELVARTRG